MHKCLTLIIALAALAPLAASAKTPVYVADNPAHETLAWAKMLTLDEATRRVRRETQGRVLSVRTVSRGGVRIYVIKVLMPSGRVRIVRIDAASGQTIRKGR